MAELPGIGVFGTGPYAYAIIPNLRKTGYKIEAVWDRKREDAEKAATDLGIPFYTNKIDDVLLRKDVDLILILCPPFHHSQIAVKALGIGKHVCVQSPGGLNQNETLRMVQAAQYYPTLNSVLIHGLRFLPAFVRMKSELENGYIGDLRLCDVRINMGSLTRSNYNWNCDDVMGGGVLTRFGSQLIDLLHYITGQKAVRVHGVVRTFMRQTDNISGIRAISSDDLTTFQMEMSRGAFATVTLNSHYVEGFSQEVTISGSRGYLSARNGNLYGRNNDEDCEERLYICGESSLSKSEDDDPNLPQSYLQGISAMFEHLARNFSSSYNGGVMTSNSTTPNSSKTKTWATFEDALYIQAVVEAVKTSSKEKSWTKVSFVDWWK